MINSIKIIAYLVLVSAVPWQTTITAGFGCPRMGAANVRNAAISAAAAGVQRQLRRGFSQPEQRSVADIAVGFAISTGCSSITAMENLAILADSLRFGQRSGCPLANKIWSSRASAVDFDNNGWQDVLIIGWNNSHHTFPTTRSAQFLDHILANQFPPIDRNAGVWADIDRDGDLDLFITDEHHPKPPADQWWLRQFHGKKPLILGWISPLSVRVRRSRMWMATFSRSVCLQLVLRRTLSQRERHTIRAVSLPILQFAGITEQQRRLLAISITMAMRICWWPIVRAAPRAMRTPQSREATFCSKKQYVTAIRFRDAASSLRI